jgi:hypothetical protein
VRIDGDGDVLAIGYAEPGIKQKRQGVPMHEPTRSVDKLEISSDIKRRGDLCFALLTAAALLITHAIAFLLHEYSHAVTAWLLGFKSNPADLHYGRLDLSNLLLQQDINENVDYTVIFGAGHGFEAAIIALAGAGIGNGLLYVLCALFLKRQISRMRPAAVLILFWLALMASGNLWSYAPVRTITTHGDMALVAQGLGISAWALFPFVVLPSLWSIWHLFTVLLPRVLDCVCGHDVFRRCFVTAVACFMIFGFFGMPGIGGSYGNVSAVFSILSLFVLLPVAVAMTLSPAAIRAGGEAAPFLDAAETKAA